MRTPIAALLGVLVLAGCEGRQSGDGQSGGPWSSGAYGGGRWDAEGQDEMARMQAAWMDSRQEVVEARAEARRAGRPIPPEVDAEVTELLDRDVGGPTEEVRLERLRDAVSDARRLAELVSPG